MVFPSVDPRNVWSKALLGLEPWPMASQRSGKPRISQPPAQRGVQEVCTFGFDCWLQLVPLHSS